MAPNPQSLADPAAGSSPLPRPVLEVPGDVDSTRGAIDAPGDVQVRGGIKAGSILRAAGLVQVAGRIEPAFIRCAGDLLAQGGITGGEAGQVQVGGRLAARYLDNVTGQVTGDLNVEREIINCHLTVHGAVRAPAGLIIGGRLVIVGAVEVDCVGSAAGVATELVLGSVPQLEPLEEQLQPVVAGLAARREALLAEQKQINTNTRRLTAQDRERQTEIHYEISRLNERHGQGLVALEGLRGKIAERRTVALSAARMIYFGTVIVVGDQSFRMKRDLEGPVQVLRRRGDVVFRRGEVEQLLHTVAEVHVARPDKD